jgi:hypothetical protein
MAQFKLDGITDNERRQKSAIEMRVAAGSSVLDSRRPRGVESREEMKSAAGFKVSRTTTELDVFVSGH